MQVYAAGAVDRDDDGTVWIVTPYVVTQYRPDGSRIASYPEAELFDAVILYIWAALVVAARAVRAFVTNPPTRPAPPPLVAPIRHGKKRPR
jgi:hypothetical protein